jgi:hypothetical protein
VAGVVATLAAEPGHGIEVGADWRQECELLFQHEKNDNYIFSNIASYSNSHAVSLKQRLFVRYFQKNDHP